MTPTQWPAVVRHHEHEYRFVRAEPYVRKSDGVPSVLLVWQGRCAECDCAFEVMTGPTPDPTRMIRTCPEHRLAAGQTSTVAATNRRTAGASRGRRMARTNARLKRRASGSAR